MKTFVINLDRNPERMAFMREQLDRMGLPFERYKAVLGSALTLGERDRLFAKCRSFIASKKQLSDAEIGVALSHAGCYKRMLEQNLSSALILEDDVRLSVGFMKTLSRVEAFLDPARPQVVMLSGYGVPDADKQSESIRPEKSVWCADAYCLTLAAAELILKANYPVITVADSFKRWHRRYGLELYRAFPTTAKQDDVSFASENCVLPKSNFWVRNVMWLLDWTIWRVTGR